MAIINNVNEVLHRIRVKLYPNYLPQVDGAYIARTSNEASLSIEDVCAALKNRGGFTGNYGDLIENIRQFFDEMAYQLCDGFAVSTGYFSVHPNVGGTFNSSTETHDPKKQPVTFRFRTLSALRNLAKLIVIDVDGLADVTGYIDNFTDIEEKSINGIFLPGNLFTINGYKIKVAGDNPSVGVYFVPLDDPSKAAKVTRIAENTAANIIGIAPNTGYMHNKIEIRTQYSGSNTLLKAPRVISSSFNIEAA
jgi:hypothetical protein